jgi:hypothetical protein
MKKRAGLRPHGSLSAIADEVQRVGRNTGEAQDISQVTRLNSWSAVSRTVMTAPFAGSSVDRLDAAPPVASAVTPVRRKPWHTAVRRPLSGAGCR